MYKYIIYQSSTGYEVYVDMLASPAGQYVSRQPYIINLLKEVMSKQKLNKDSVIIEHDMGRIIGNTDIVETSEKDTIYYAQAYKKHVFSRYAKNRTPSPSTMLTILLEKDSNGNYELKNTWIGPHTPPFPGDELATSISKVYWENHALVQDSEAVQSKTITKVCPY